MEAALAIGAAVGIMVLLQQKNKASDSDSDSDPAYEFVTLADGTVVRRESFRGREGYTDFTYYSFNSRNYPEMCAKHDHVCNADIVPRLWKANKDPATNAYEDSLPKGPGNMMAYCSNEAQDDLATFSDGSPKCTAVNSADKNQLIELLLYMQDRVNAYKDTPESQNLLSNIRKGMMTYQNGILRMATMRAGRNRDIPQNARPVGINVQGVMPIPVFWWATFVYRLFENGVSDYPPESFRQIEPETKTMRELENGLNNINDIRNAMNDCVHGPDPVIVSDSELQCIRNEVPEGYANTFMVPDSNLFF